MKIVLSALNAKYVHSNLAVYDLEAYARKNNDFLNGKLEDSDGLDGDREMPLSLVVREFTINHNLDFILQELYQEKAAVYAFACYIWNIYEILTICRELNKVLPKSRIWFGGPEASNDARKYLEFNSFIEGVILGEGEVTFNELIREWYFANRCVDMAPCYAQIHGIMYRGSDDIIYQTEMRELMPLDDLPFIYYDLSRFQNKILYYETSRGCPFSCSYCLSSIEKRVRFRSFSLVKKELDFFLEHKVPQVKFVDRTFNCNREHSLQIWKYINEHDNGVTNFHFEVAADLIGEEELEVFRVMRSGLIQLEIGLQSTNPDTIREIRRVMDVDKVRQTMLTIRTFGNIHQHLDLIAGLPYENLESFKKSFNDAYAMKPNQLQLGFLKVLKGSYMGEQVGNYQLKYRDAQPYEVLSTKWISYDEILILKRVEEMVEVYYNSDQFEHVLPYILSFFDSPYDFFEAIGKYYEEKQLFGIGFKREARYTALRDFCLLFFADSEKTEREKNFVLSVLDCLLTFDFYLRENAKTRPLWAGKERIDRAVYHNFFKQGGNGEISLKKGGYDSKVAARMMHIEVLEQEALVWLSDQLGEEKQCDSSKYRYCLFDYEKRNPLSRDAMTVFLSELL